ncbi:Flp pilus assembly protein CpaB [Pseudalkalibacillus caeni]|uniref:Flp pilus assembly protein CpaB n=1 Tax=Exobacillus caeni TaxID=2574798 RepID=A0A5R9EZF1_9BACL|nr:Flp pilus assembly protein CpaB [Pseudalkalibacillus caeni]TLS35576.1 Flp pilus assembly protein CpaB [Pseudalkalibacillus caeni]
MNKKIIWMLAITFGLFSSLFLYVSIYPSGEEGDEQVKQEESAEVNQPEETEKQNDSKLSITEGSRAVSIMVDEVQGVAGYVQPEDHVDVVYVNKQQDGKGTSQILFQDVRVLAAGPASQQLPKAEETPDGTAATESKNGRANGTSPSAYQNVTLEIKPNEGAAIVLAANTGTIHLLLREKEDHSKVPHTHVSQEQLAKGVDSE